MRSTFAALVALAAAASPAAAQSCGCGGDAGPATVAVPRTRYVPHTRYSPETVLVARTRYERRVIYVPRTRLVPQTVEVARTEYLPRTTYTLRPAPGDSGADRASEYGPAASGLGYGYGATYVPPGAIYGCRLGTVGCDSGAVGPLDH
jgi:hypothetical protein